MKSSEVAQIQHDGAIEGHLLIQGQVLGKVDGGVDLQLGA